MNGSDITREIRNFILENYLFTDDDTALDNTTSFLETGLLDSTGMMELVMFIEETFDLSVADDELLPENLDSVNNAIAFISSKLKAA